MRFNNFKKVKNMNKLKEIKVIYETDEDNESISELISDCFYKNNIKGLVIEFPQEKTEEWGEDAVLNDRYCISAYLQKDQIQKKDIIKKDIYEILKSLNVNLKFEERNIEEKDWAHSWKDFFYPVEISEKTIIKPTWRNIDKDYEIVIEIDPGMAFGSGSHSTTNLCIKMLEETIEKDQKLLDIGCGSGILMVAGSKFGAKFVKGIDNDGLAVEISESNMILNNIEKDKFEVLKSDLIKDENDKYDIIVSNILAEVICGFIPDLHKVTKKSTKIIFSGIIEEKKDMVIKKMNNFDIKVEKIYEDSGWICIRGIYK